MKLVPLLLCLFCTSAKATPYFRFIDLGHPQPVIGALVDPMNYKKTSASSLLPIFTHSPNDGCLLPSIVCEDWTPLALGAAVNEGNFTFDVAPLANVLPWMAAAGYALTPASWSGLRHIFAPAVQPALPVTFSAGPVWEYQERTNKGYLKIFTGLALHF